MPSSERVLVFDLETVPDLDRAESFGLDPLPELPPTLPPEECKSTPWLDGTIGDFERRLKELQPDEGFVRTLADLENKSVKPRKGVIGAIDGYLKSRQAIASAGDDRIKLMSIVPEYCKVIAVGFSRLDGDPDDFILADAISDRPEYEALNFFWDLASDANILVGFNCLHFDLPVIFIRSMLLGVQPTREINLSPYGNQVIDLYTRRFPKGNGKGPGSLKDLCRVLGIPNDIPDMDGGDVFAAYEAGDWDRIRRYVRSDVAMTRELFSMYRGLFC